MPDLTAKRTLVKSPPELWEELSEVERLAKHLGAFGEITITKLEPEHTVAWEGEHASGTVSIEPSGWGTRVTLRAELPEVPEPQEPEPEEPEPEPEPEPVPDPVAEEPVAEEPEPASIEEPVAEEPVAEEPEPASIEEPGADATAERPRRGFWGWLFRARRAEPAAEQPDPAAAKPDPVVVGLEPVAAERAPVAAEPEPAAAEPKLPAAEPEPAAAKPEPAAAKPEPPAVEPEPEPTAHAVPQEIVDIRPKAAAPTVEDPEAVEAEAADAGDRLDPERALVILDEALDTLGAAHHRPFSRS
jgi:hypothetical protein